MKVMLNMKGILNMKNNIIKMVLFGLALSVASPAVCRGSASPEEAAKAAKQLAVKAAVDDIFKRNPALLDAQDKCKSPEEYLETPDLTADIVTQLIIDVIKLGDFRFLWLEPNKGRYGNLWGVDYQGNRGYTDLRCFSMASEGFGKKLSPPPLVDLERITGELNTELASETSKSTSERDYTYVRSLKTFISEANEMLAQGEKVDLGFVDKAIKGKLAFAEVTSSIEKISLIESIQEIVSNNALIAELEKERGSLNAEQVKQLDSAKKKLEQKSENFWRAQKTERANLINQQEQLLTSDNKEVYPQVLERLNLIKKHLYASGEPLAKKHRQLEFHIGECLKTGNYPTFIGIDETSESLSKFDFTVKMNVRALIETLLPAFIHPDDRNECEKLLAKLKDCKIDYDAAVRFINAKDRSVTDEDVKEWSVETRTAYGYTVIAAEEVIRASSEADVALKQKAQALKEAYDAALQKVGTSLAAIVKAPAIPPAGGGAIGDKTFLETTTGKLAIVGGVVAAVGAGCLIYRKWQKNKEKKSEAVQDVGQASLATDLEG